MAAFGMWKLGDFDPGDGVRCSAFAESFDDSGWVDIPVPGDIHRALIAAGRIEDPFYDQNELKCAWIEEREWWYRTRFDGPADAVKTGERHQLVFHGLDTYVTIWLNGQELGSHANMFREVVFDVTDRLRLGQPNTLALCFDRPLDHVHAVDGFQPWNPENHRVYMRKAQFGYGWDWGPRLPTVGVWRPVELRRQDRAALQGINFYTLHIEADESRALVAVKVEIERFASYEPLTAHICLESADSQSAVEQTLTITGSEATAYVQVDKPRLWWTHDLGTPDLYTLDVTLLQKGTQLDHRQLQVGIRTIELDQSPDQEESGTRFFRFVVNGVPIFAKGANWIPADSFVGSITPERYKMLLSAARDANMNMIRLWGGGIYEHDAFYETCDRLGLLIWNDFMFACEAYPDNDPVFAGEVEAEARYQVRRLRSHPSLALWCGNNENQVIHDLIFWDRPDLRVPGWLFYSDTFPRVVKELDGHTPYWPGSPYGGNGFNSAEDGDRHNWQVWHGFRPRRFGEPLTRDGTPEGVSFAHYANDMARFISEFGMHASPVEETLRRCIPADQLYHHSPSMDHHNKDNPKDKGDNLMETVTGLPKTMEEYIDFSMIAQAEGLKFGIEHYRRRKPHCSGTLFWQLNDCWPVLSWSVLDYYGFGKAGYYYAKRAFAPVLASFKELDDGGLELWVTNDTLSKITETVSVRLGTFDGATQWAENVPVHMTANSSQAVQRWRPDQLQVSADPYISVHSAIGTFPANRLFFVPIKDLNRSPVQPEMTITQTNAQELRVHLRAPGYAFFVHLKVPVDQTKLDDNYFDMEPGEERSIVISNPVTALAPNMVTLGWR